MARTESSLNCIGFTQQFQAQYWQWSGADSTVLEDVRQRRQEIKAMADIILRRLTDAGMQVAEMYVIRHDKDMEEAWVEAEQKTKQTPKADHIHGLVKFVQGKGGTLNDIASAIGLQTQYVEKAGKGKYAYDNMLAYLIHIKYTDKHQYDPSEVYTAAGRDYKSYSAERMEAWIKGRATVQRKCAVEGIDSLEEKILSGEITKNQILLTDELYAVYARGRARCDEAFATYAERKAALTMRALDDGEFKLTVFFIYGAPGAGKTSIVAKRLVNMVIQWAHDERGERWTQYKTAATNAMDDYDGSEIILMDDVRGGTMCAEDWLHLLDAHNITSASARYHNKTPAPRLLIITSTKDPVEFFYFCKQAGGGDRSEMVDQFLRRIQSLVTVTRTEDRNRPLVSVADSYRGEPRMYHIDGGHSANLCYNFTPTKQMPNEEALKVMLGKVVFNQLPQEERDYVDLMLLLDGEIPEEILKELAEMPEPDCDDCGTDVTAVKSQCNLEYIKKEPFSGMNLFDYYYHNN